MAEKKLTKNHALFGKAKRYLVGGVDSPVRSFRSVGGEPVLIKRAKGSKVYDYDSNEYIDYVLSWGAAILGHAHPAVVNAVKRSLGPGLGFGTTNENEVKLAEAIRQAIPVIKKIRFTTSGTEAVMGALRLARGYTKRDKIVKFEGAYHGHADYLLAKSGSGLATLGIPSSAGVPKNFVKDTIVIPFGDEKALGGIFKRYGRQIAAVIVEPVGGNYGVRAPDQKFLKGIRRITKRYGSLMIVDEIITGFRFSFGSVSREFGIVPDLVCLGKIIGGGLPIGAYGGNEKTMRHLSPVGDVYQASTFSGNPIVMESGLATLRLLKGSAARYAKAGKLTEYLSARLGEEAMKNGVGLSVIYSGPMFSLRFKNGAHFRVFYRRMLEKGVYLAPSEYEANFLSFAHTRSDIEKTVSAARYAFGKIKQARVR